MNVSLDLNQIEYATQVELNEFQLGKIHELFDYLVENSPYYKRLFEEKNIQKSDIQTLDDLRKIPTTNKQTLADHTDDFLCVPKSEISDFTTTSGTIGNPVTVYLTAKDIDRLAYNEAMSMKKAGCSSNDVFQLATTMDKRFMAGLAYAEGVRKLKGGLIRVGASSPALQWDSIERFNPTVLIAIPAFVLALIDYAKANNIDYKNSSLHKVIAIGQPVRDQNFDLNKISSRIEEEWGLQVFSTYASTEMAAAFTECEHGKGGHLQPDLIYFESLNEKDEPVQSGELGEIVITNLGVEGMPLLRYRTGDLAAHYREQCACGRTTLRVGPIIGRKNQMIKFKGTTVHPQVILPFVDTLRVCSEYLLELSTDDLGLDNLTVVFPEEEVNDDQATKAIQQIADLIKVKPNYRFIPLKSIRGLVRDPSSRKPVKIHDLR